MEKNIFLVTAAQARKNRKRNRAFFISLKVLLLAFSLSCTGLFLTGCADSADDDYLRRYDTHDDTKARAAKDTQDDDTSTVKPGDNPDQSNMN